MVGKGNQSQLEMVSSEIRQICNQATNVVIPKEHLPPLGISQQLKNCDATNLYYGFTTPPNLEQARWCAYQNPDQDDHYDILTMIYANGKGVSKHLDLAIHFACKGGFAPAEIEGRVKHLLVLKIEHTNTEFDICDDITSGYMMGVCAKHQQLKQLSVQKKTMDKLMNDFNGMSQETFFKLQHAAQHYFETRIKNEVDLSGTARAAWMIDEENKLKQAFTEILTQLKNKTFPVFTAKQLIDADRELNAIYLRIQKNKNNKKLTYTTINSDGIKKTQGAWLQYRDAFAAFVVVQYHAVDAVSIKALLTKQRVKMLKNFL